MGVIADIHNDLEKSAIQLIVEYRERLFGVAVGLCKDEALAEDLVFRTIERVVSKADQCKSVSNLFGWMKSILENIYKDDMKRPVVRGTKVVDADELERCAGIDWNTDEQILKHSDSEAIRAALSGLDPKLHKVVLLRYYEELSLREIANVLRLPIGTVAWRVHTAHRLLAGKLRNELEWAKKPLAVLAAALSFSFLSFAAVVTVPAFTPVRDAVAGWFAGGDTGETGDGGTGVPPVQEEAVSSTPTKQNTTTPQKEPTMNIKKIAVAASAAMLGLAVRADAHTDVEYITASAANKNWILLDYKPVEDTIIEATIAVPADKITKTHQIFCAYKSDKDHTYSCKITSQNFRFDYGNALGTPAGRVEAETKYVITCNPADGLSVQGGIYEVDTLLDEKSIIKGFVAGNKLVLFANYQAADIPCPNANSTYATLKVYGVRIWEGEQTDDRLLYDLRPCKDAQGVECLRDAKNGNLLYHFVTDSRFTKKDGPGWWGDADNWTRLPDMSSSPILFDLNDGTPLNACLQDGDSFTYPNATMRVACNTRNPSTAVTTATVTIPTNASLTVGMMSVGSAGVTGVVEVVGGTLSARYGITCGTSGSTGIIKAKDATVTGISPLGSGTGRGCIEADHSYLKTAKGAQWPIGWSDADNYVSLKNGSTLEVAQNLWLGVNGSAKNLRGSLYAEDSLIVVTNGSVSFATGGRGALALTNSTLRVSGDFTSGARQFYAAGSEGTPVVEQIGASTNQLGGSLSLWGNFRYLLDGKGKQAKLQCSSINFNPCDAGVTQRFELVSGEVVLPSSETQANGLYKDCSGVASFSMRGSSSRMTLSFIRRRTSVDPLLMEFIIDRTGAPCIKYDIANSTYNVPTAALTAKLHGGLQLLHTNTFVFADSHVDGKATANLRAAYNWQAKRTYADLNPAEHHLWTLGPQSDGNDHPIGVLAGTKTFGAELNAAEELEIGMRYAEGRTCGWVRLPKFSEKMRFCRVQLEIVPQNGHTLKEIADGMLAAGYKVKCLSNGAKGAYILQVSLSAKDLREGSETEVVAFDFAEYGTFAAVHSLTPTDVRALVHQVNVIQGPGMMLLVK